MYLEKRRLKTFFQFPNDVMDIRLLAKSGLYYLGEGEICKCFFCEVEISQWYSYKNPIIEHIQLSMGCPLLANKFTNNIPIDKTVFIHMLNSIY